jgi:outer membrane protein
MKKISTVLWIPEFMAVTLLFIACGNAGTVENKDSTTQQTPSSSQQAITTKITDIAYINVDSIFQRYDYQQDLTREFEQKVNKKQTEFQSKKSAYEAEVNTFNEKYKKMLLTRSEVEEQSQRIQQREAELGAESQRIMQELSEEQTVLNRKVVDAIYRYVEKYNVEKKYSLILSNATIIVGSPSMDITAEILSGLNREYIANKPK